MSLAYPPRLVKYLFSSTKERDKARKSDLKPNYYGLFPRSFGLYYSCYGDDFLSQHFYISTLPEAAGEPREDIYAITFHKGPGMKQMTLYSTAEHGSRPLAIATTEKLYGSSVAIRMPGCGEGESERIERLKSGGGFVENTYSFELDGDEFELRETQGRPRTRTLMKLNAAASGRCQHNTEPKTCRCPGDEVIVTWREGSVPNREGRLAAFRFEDENAAQKMGEYGNLLVVCAFLAVCQQGGAVECTHTWQEEKFLEKSNYR